MVSRKECDDAYRLIGYESFQIVDRDELEESIQTMVLRLGDTITNEQRLMLMNARRANNLACFEETQERINDKLQTAFDQVDAVELCSESAIFPSWCCVLWVRETPQPNEFLCVPLIKYSYLYNKLLSSGDYCIATCDEMIMLSDEELLLPSNVQERRYKDIEYLVHYQYLKEIDNLDWIKL